MSAYYEILPPATLKMIVANGDLKRAFEDLHPSPQERSFTAFTMVASAFADLFRDRHPEIASGIEDTILESEKAHDRNDRVATARAMLAIFRAMDLLYHEATPVERLHLASAQAAARYIAGV